MRVVSPARAAIRARAALTVVLPTPPFPATMSTRVWEQNPAGSKCSSPLETAIRRLVSALIVLGTLASVAMAGASAPAQAAPARGWVDIIEVSGLIDPVMADFVTSAVRGAEAHRALAVVVQLDSRDGVLSAGRLRRLEREVAGSSVPVGVWVGGTGRPRAYRQAYGLFLAGTVRGV